MRLCLLKSAVMMRCTVNKSGKDTEAELFFELDNEERNQGEEEDIKPLEPV